jgi:hypothetical protein
MLFTKNGFWELMISGNYGRQSQETNGHMIEHAKTMFFHPPKSNVFCITAGFSGGRFFLTILFFFTRHLVATFFSLTEMTSQTVGILEVAVMRCFWRGGIKT